MSVRRGRRAGSALCGVLLAGALLASGCSFQLGGGGDTTTTAGATAPSPTTTAAPPIETRSVTVQGVTVYSGPDGSRGEPTDKTVTVAPSTTGRIAVGVIEGEVFGTGPQWRVAAWSAALAASNLLSVDLSDYKITYEVAGRIDGPSAGAILTVATLAALLGDEVLPDVTMTGTINPDYTVGPVGGIPHKVEAAVKAGKTRFLIPTGQRMDMDENLNEWVDVVDRGSASGVEVIEVGDVFEAYQLMTGMPLPQPRVVAREPVLSAAAHQVLLDQAVSWIDYCNQELEEYVTLPDAAKSDYEDGRVQYARDALQEADRYAGQGLVATSLSSATEAARQALLAVNYTLVEQSIQEQGQYAAGQALAAGGVTDSLNVLMDELIAVEPSNVGEAVTLVEAWGYWSVAGRLAYEADYLMADLSDAEGEVEGRLGDIYTAVFDYTLATVSRDSAYDALALGKVLRGEPIRGQERLTELAEVYRRVAEATLETVQVLVLPGVAEQRGMREDEAYSALLQEDVNLAEAEAAVGDQNYLLNSLPEGPNRDYAVLGAALVGYAGSAASVAEHYSYGAQYDEEGDIIGFDSEKALVEALDFARTRGQKLIALASRRRADPALPVMYYEAAGLARDGYPGQKIDALYGYWTAAMYAQIMAVLSGDLEPLAPR
ncbi:MAG: S16 family serine protease [Thermoleophilia bacterium]